jgi:hypothetical protein
MIQTHIFPENVLTPEQLEINRWIMRLDTVAVDYESRWGIGRLEALAAPVLREKWERQREKLNYAIQRSDLTILSDLIEGTVRGWAALEQAALLAGHKPHDPEFWECVVDGVTYRITRTMAGSRNMAAVPGNGAVLSLGEIVSVYHYAHSQAFENKHPLPGKDIVVNEKLFKDGGDPIPF